MSDVLEIAVRETKIVRIGEREYTLTFPVAAVVVLEQKLGRSMKHSTDWFRIKAEEVQPCLEAGLTHHHPEEAATVAAEICNTLDPEAIDSVVDALCATACPKAWGRLLEEMAKARQRLQKGLSPVPNGQGADAS